MPEALNALFSTLMDTFRRVGGHAEAIDTYGVDHGMAAKEIVRRLHQEDDDTMAGLELVASMAADITGLSGGPTPLMREIDRMLDAAPGNAIECAVVLVGMPTPIQGSLAKADNGLLRLLTPAPPRPRSKHVDSEVDMVEQFFDPASVVCVAVVRTVIISEAPRIVTS